MEGKDIGNNIRVMRDRIGLSQEDIAKYLNVDRVAISNYENGKRQVPLNALEKLSDLFGLELTDLISGTPDDINIIAAFAFRAGELLPEDLEPVARFRKIVKNYLKLQSLDKQS